MRIVELKIENNKITLFNDGTKESFDDLPPMDMIVTAIAKDVLEQIRIKSKLLHVEIEKFSVQIILRTNTVKDKSKVIETYLNLPDTVPQEIKSKLYKIADKAHLKRMLSNEIVFATSGPKE